MLNRFVMDIRTDNAAFADDAAPEVARILRDIASRLESGSTGAPVHDINGNRVGSWRLETEHD